MINRKYAIIVVKNDYEKLGDLVFRPLIRAYKRLGINELIKDDKAIILGYINEKGMFCEFFTSNEIDYDNYIVISEEELEQILLMLNLETQDRIIDINQKMLSSLGLNEDLDNNPLSINNLAYDRKIEFDAYNSGLSMINPYREPFNGYNDFNYKCMKLQKIRK